MYQIGELTFQALINVSNWLPLTSEMIWKGLIGQDA